MNEETKLMSELEEFDPVPLHVPYPAALAPRLRPEDGKHAVPWRVVIPDLPGCRASGETQEEAMTNAIEAVEIWTQAALKGGSEVPAPSFMDALAKLSEYAGWTWFFVGSARLTAADQERVDEVVASEPEPFTPLVIKPPSIIDMEGGTPRLASTQDDPPRGCAPAPGGRALGPL
jgi:predicted RNase H-like HicB family nuclease